MKKTVPQFHIHLLSDIDITQNDPEAAPLSYEPVTLSTCENCNQGYNRSVECYALTNDGPEPFGSVTHCGICDACEQCALGIGGQYDTRL